MTSTHKIRIGRRSLDVQIASFDRHHRTMSWRIEYEREFNEHGRLICCGFHEPRLDKITRDDGALIEAALWEIIDREGIEQ